MVSYLDGLFEESDKPVQLLDGDTSIDPDTGESIRFANVDTPETFKVLDDGTIKEGDVGGMEAALITQNLMNKEGFTNLHKVEEDKYGRTIGLHSNDKGEFAQDKQLASGIAVPTLFSSYNDINTAIIGRLDRERRKQHGEQTEWDIAGDSLNKFIADNSEFRRKAQVIDEQEYAAVKNYFGGDQFQTDRYFSRSAGFRRGDRTLDNRAASIGKTSWAVAKKGFGESAYAAMDWFTDIFGYDLAGEGNVKRMQNVLAELPILENQNAFDEEGNWRLDSVSSVGDWLITNAIISSPYLVMTAASTLATPLALVPALVYTGDTYSKMDEKDPLLAAFSGVGQAVLDRVGISLLLPKGSAKYASTDIIRNAAAREAAIQSLIKTKGITRKEALKELTDAVAKEVGSFARGAKAGIAQKIRDKYFTDSIGGAVLKGTAGEAITEVMQETIGYLAENNLDFDKMDLREYQNRALNAAAAGGALGGSLGGITQAGSNFSRYSTQKGTSDADPTARNRDLKRRDDLIRKAKESGNEDIDLSTDAISRETDNVQPEQSLADIAAPEKDRREKTSFIGSVMKAFKERGLKGGAIGYMKGLDEIIQSSPYLTKALSLVGANDVFSNGGLEQNQHIKESNLHNIIGTQDEALSNFGAKNTTEISNIVYSKETENIYNLIRRNILAGEFANVKEAYKGISTKFNINKDNEALLIDYLQRIFDFDVQRARLRNVNIKDVNFYNDKVWDKRKIISSRDQFINDLIEELSITRDAAIDFTNNLLDGTENELIALHDSTLEEMFARLDEVKLNSISKQSILENPRLGKYFNNDMFYNVSGMAGTTASAWANHKYLGSNGHRIAWLIEQAMKHDNVSRETAEMVAQEFIDVMDIRKGKYKQIESQTYKTIQSNLITVSSMAQLPLATTSAIVEVSMGAYNVPRSIIFQQMPKIVHSFLTETFSFINSGLHKASFGLVKRNSYIDYNKPPNEKPLRQQLGEYGFLLESQSALQKHDVNISQGQQRLMHNFFKFIGLQGLTNFTRTIPLANAADTIFGLLTDVMMDTKVDVNGNVVRTIQGQQSREALMRLGIDVDKMVDHLNNGMMDSEFAKDQMKLATFNFVNSVVAHPTKTNRPKFYYNPRFALFFHLQGFISTFTATILPQMYNQVIGRGKVPAARAEAIRNILTLLMFGYMSTMLRDMIKTGEIPDEDDVTNRLRRMVNASGVLGTGERIVNRFFPLYPERADNLFEEAAQLVAGEAPALNYMANVGTMIEDMFDNERSGREVQRMVKAAPFFGPFHSQFRPGESGPLREAMNPVADFIDDLF